MNLGTSRGQALQAEGTAYAKALGQDCAGGVGGRVRRLVGLKQSRGEGREGTGQDTQGLLGCREDLGFFPKAGGSHGGLWAEEGRDLT